MASKQKPPPPPQYATRKVTRLASASTPGTPVDPSATPAIPEPTPSAPPPRTPDAAHSLLVSHALIARKEVYSPQTIITALHGLALAPNVAAAGHSPFLIAIALLVPRAFKSTNAVCSDLDIIKEKSDALDKKLDKVLSLVENPILVEDEVGGKVDALLNKVTKFNARTEVVEQAAKDTQSKVTTLLETHTARDQQSGWSKVTPGNSHTHKGPTPKKPSTDAPSQGNGAPPELDAQALKHAHSQATTILIHPNAGAAGSSMDGKSSADLIKWLGAAIACTLDQIEKRGLFPKLGLETTPHITFTKATHIPSGGVLFECVSRHHAALLSTVSVAKALEQNLGGYTCKGQRAEILLYTAPTCFNPDDPASVQDLERENQIEVGSILHCTWVKPIARRHPQQTRAVLKIALRPQNTADNLISRTGRMDAQDVKFKRIEEEPTRCLKCQRYGHRVVDCKHEVDVCSQCGDNHRSSNCPNRRRRYCVNCRSDHHALWYRLCPVFIQECDRINKTKPENKRRYFDPEREDPSMTESLAKILPPAAHASPTRPTFTLANVLDENAELRQADFLARSKQIAAKPVPPPVATPGYESDAWDSESHTGAADEGPATPVRSTPQPSSPPPVERAAGLNKGMGRLSIGSKKSMHFPLTKVTVSPSMTPRSRVCSASTSSVLTVSSISSASTIVSATRERGSFPGSFSPSQ